MGSSSFYIVTPCKRYSQGERKPSRHLKYSEKSDSGFSYNLRSSFSRLSKHFDILNTLLLFVIIFCSDFKQISLVVSEFREIGIDLGLN